MISGSSPNSILPAPLRYAQLRGLLLSNPFTRFAETAKRAPGSGRSAMMARR